MQSRHCNLSFMHHKSFNSVSSITPKISSQIFIVLSTHRSMNFTKNCYPVDDSEVISCKCDYLHFSEPPYEAFGKYICGQMNHYTTRTRTLSIKYFYRSNHRNVFLLTYISESNLHHKL